MRYTNRDIPVFNQCLTITKQKLSESENRNCKVKKHESIQNLTIAIVKEYRAVSNIKDILILKEQ